MNPGVLQPEESKILVARSHFCCCCRDDSRMKRQRPWVSSVLMLFGSAPAPYITNTTDAAGFRGYWQCSGLCSKAACEAPGPRVPWRNLHHHLISAANARVLKVISHQKKNHCNAALGHQKPPVLWTRSRNWWPQRGDRREWVCHRNWIRANWWYYSLGYAGLVTNHSAMEQ